MQGATSEFGIKKRINCRSGICSRLQAFTISIHSKQIEAVKTPDLNQQKTAFKRKRLMPGPSRGGKNLEYS